MAKKPWKPVARGYRIARGFECNDPYGISTIKQFRRTLGKRVYGLRGFASLEIAFRMPIEETTPFSAAGIKSPEVKVLEKVGELLEKGLSWLTSEAAKEAIYASENAGEREAVLRALKELTPATYGNIETIELRGQMMPSQSLHKDACSIAKILTTSSVVTQRKNPGNLRLSDCQGFWTE